MALAKLQIVVHWVAQQLFQLAPPLCHLLPLQVVYLPALVLLAVPLAAAVG
jgi:hypothetical protein